MLHAKFQDQRTSGSREEDFSCFQYTNMTLTIYTNFRSEAPHAIEFDW